jgi:hypothetical protein
MNPLTTPKLRPCFAHPQPNATPPISQVRPFLSTVCALASLLLFLNLTSAQAQWWWHSYSTNPPALQIVTPHDGAFVLAGSDLHICAEARYFTDRVDHVEFFQGTTSLGVVSNTAFALSGDDWSELGNVFCFTWTNVPLGNFALSSVATDVVGNSATSSVVNISAVADIPPKIYIFRPHNGALILGPSDVKICAAAFDQDGSVSNVQFFADGASLGAVTNSAIFMGDDWGFWHFPEPYCLTWSNAPTGDHTLTAVATDNGGISSTSAPVNISIVTNFPPMVHIFRPRDGSTIYNAPVNIHICSYEKYFANPIASVEFFAGATSVGSTTNAPYSCIVWSNAPAGIYSLTAVATDVTSLSVTSAPVNITVSTNRPPFESEGGEWGHDE